MIWTGSCLHYCILAQSGWAGEINKQNDCNFDLHLSEDTAPVTASQASQEHLQQ